MAHDLIPTAPSDAGLVALLLQQLRVWKGNPRKVVGDLSDLPRVERLFAGLPQGRLYSALAKELRS